MKTKTIFLIIFCFGALSLNFAGKNSSTEPFTSEPETEMYTSYSGKFKVKFPGTPTTNTQALDLGKLGKTTLYSFIYSDETSAYMISYCDYPPDAIANSNTKDVLKKSKEGFEKNLNLTTDEMAYILLQTNDGIWFKSKSNEYYAEMKNFLVGNRLYQLGVMRANHYPNSEAEKTFLNSLAFL